MSKTTKFIKTSKFPITFDRLHPGSTFIIHAERSRGFNFSRDYTVYRKATDAEGFYAYPAHDKTKAACLMPSDMVWPVKEQRSS